MTLMHASNPFATRRPEHGVRRLALRTAGLISLALVAGLSSGCTKNATTGRNQLDLMSRDQEMALGASEGPKLTQEFGGEVQNPALRGYIDEVGQKLKNYTEVDGPQRTWVFTLLDSDVINAFALPGERVFMSRGLADKLTSEAQLAGVLGHEIGHVMARHSNERMSQGLGAQILTGAAQVIAGATVKDPTLAGAVPQVVSAGGQLVTLKFSREQESEADALGMRYMTKAGYNPRGQLEVMQVLDREAGGGSSPEWMATHPLPKTRIQEVQKRLDSEYAYTQNGPQAGNYQTYADRYRQRYLAIRASEPPKPSQKKPAGKTGAAGLRKSSMLPTDEHGRSRLLAPVVLEDPTTWCAVCMLAAQHQQDDVSGR